MAKATSRKGMQLFDADEALIGMIAGARGNTITVGGGHIPKAAIARVTQNRAYLKRGVLPTSGGVAAPAPIPPTVRQVGRPTRQTTRAARSGADAPPAPLAPAERTYTATPPTTVVPLAAERLHAKKRPVELGAVRVRKTVAAEEWRLLVDLNYEMVRVEERNLPDHPATGADLFREETIVVPLRGEEAVVTKEAVVTGEVVIQKDLATERRYVRDVVRAERAEVVAPGTVRRAPR